MSIEIAQEHIFPLGLSICIYSHEMILDNFVFAVFHPQSLDGGIPFLDRPQAAGLLPLQGAILVLGDVVEDGVGDGVEDGVGDGAIAHGEGVTSNVQFCLN